MLNFIEQVTDNDPDENEDDEYAHSDDHMEDCGFERDENGDWIRDDQD